LKNYLYCLGRFCNTVDYLGIPNASSILITGGAGFIGHHLVNKLSHKNCRVHIVDNLSNSNKTFLEDLRINTSFYDNVVLHEEDIEDAEALSRVLKLERIDTCIHLAAKTSVLDSVRRPSETIDINVNGTLNVLEACYKHEVENFVLASSAAVYGHSNKLPVSEQLVPQPISPYGASKVAGEALVSSYRSRIKNCASLRFFNVYGEGQSREYAGVITSFIERLTQGSAPMIYGNGLQTRDFVSVNDVVNAIMLAAEPKYELEGVLKISAPKNNIFNIGTGKPTRIIDLARKLIDIFDFNETIQPLYSKSIEGDIVYSCADIQRAKDILKYTASEDLGSALDDMVNTFPSTKNEPVLTQ
jgi:UDP-glucose 4-epimerase